MIVKFYEWLTGWCWHKDTLTNLTRTAYYDYRYYECKKCHRTRVEKS